ncbi:MAG TPA: 3-hydroxyisobutyryl-CoA hydrolase [Devosia sp.]|nr:3-hydroxyisobutyryl-CoA hydrolase [Devosia sp.]
MANQIIVSTEGAMGVIALNRPEAINALSAEMILGVTEALTLWRDDPAIGAVLFEGRGGKGFCAGGDVRAARALVLAGHQDAATAYFAAEYRINAMIAAYPKPVIALTSGIVMGGGIGIAGHCGFRISQPGARFAMPESAIGFFGDVGVNAILAKAPLNRALLFLMSGVSVGVADALGLGLADCMVAPEQLMDMRAGIGAAASATDPQSTLVRQMEAHSIVAGKEMFCALADLLPPEPPTSPQDFVERVAAIPVLEEIDGLLKTRSPTALTAIFYSHLAARSLMAVQPTLEMDLRLAALMSGLPDFAEGVRAVLVDKDNRPAWHPQHLAEVDPRPILRAIKGA